jgi:hypothetical protein
MSDQETRAAEQVTQKWKPESPSKSSRSWYAPIKAKKNLIHELKDAMDLKSKHDGGQTESKKDPSHFPKPAIHTHGKQKWEEHHREKLSQGRGDRLRLVISIGGQNVPTDDEESTQSCYYGASTDGE